MGQPSASFWHRRRVFVTGCTGFLGTWVVRELLARGAEVVGLVRDRVRPSDLFDDRLFRRIAVVRGRVEDRGRLETAFALHGVQTVFHLAAPDIALAHPDDPTTHLAARWARTVLTAAARAIPSGEVVAPVAPDDATGRTEVVSRFVQQSGYTAGLVGLPKLFGGGDRTWSRLVPWTVRALLSGRPVEPPRGDERDEPYLYVRDAAQACLEFAESLAGDPEAWSGRVNECEPTTIGGELFAAIADSFLPSPRVGEEPGERLSSPIPLPQAVAETVAWYRRFLLTTEVAGPTSPPGRLRPAA